MLTTSLLSLVPEAPLLEEALSSVDEAESVVSELVAELALPEDEVASTEVSAESALVSCGGGGGGGGIATASSDVASLEVEALLVASVEVEADEASEGCGGGGGCVAVGSVPPISSCRDKSADCMSLPSDEKPPLDDTVPDVEPLLSLSEEGGAKAVAADVPLPLDDPKRAARLPVLLVRAERDDICCLRGKFPLQL